MFGFPKVSRCFHLHRFPALNLGVDSRILRIQFENTRRFGHVEEIVIVGWCRTGCGYKCFGGYPLSALHPRLRRSGWFSPLKSSLKREKAGWGVDVKLYSKPCI